MYFKKNTGLYNNCKDILKYIIKIIIIINY